MEKDVRRFFTKHTSMSDIKTEELSPCEQDAARIMDLIEEGTYFTRESEMSSYERGLAYFFGVGEIRDDEAGLRELQQAVREDETDLKAKNMYGFACYHMSLGCRSLPEKCSWYERTAVKNWKEAAEEGQPDALFNLGVCYLEGKCIPEDELLGKECIEKAIAAGHPKAKPYLKQYLDQRGLGDVIPREDDLTAEEAVKQVTEAMRQEAADLPAGSEIYFMGIFNDIYLAQGYKWVKNGMLGWVCSKDEGKTYLISEQELKEITL